MSLVLDEEIKSRYFPQFFPVSPANHISHNYSKPIYPSVSLQTRQHVFIAGNYIIYRCFVGLSEEFKSQCAYIIFLFRFVIPVVCVKFSQITIKLYG